MLNKDNKILKYNHGENIMKVPFVIYADLECLLEKMHSYQNNFKKPYTGKKYMQTSSGYSLFTQCSFDSTKNMLDCCRGKNCMVRFCEDFKQHATKIIKKRNDTTN